MFSYVGWKLMRFSSPDTSDPSSTSSPFVRRNSREPVAEPSVTSTPLHHQHSRPAVKHDTVSRFFISCSDCGRFFRTSLINGTEDSLPPGNLQKYMPQKNLATPSREGAEEAPRTKRCSDYILQVTAQRNRVDIVLMCFMQVCYTCKGSVPLLSWDSGSFWNISWVGCELRGKLSGLSGVAHPSSWGFHTLTRHRPMKWTFSKFLWKLSGSSFTSAPVSVHQAHLPHRSTLQWVKTQKHNTSGCCLIVSVFELNNVVNPSFALRGGRSCCRSHVSALFYYF